MLPLKVQAIYKLVRTFNIKYFQHYGLLDILIKISMFFFCIESVYLDKKINCKLIYKMTCILIVKAILQIRIFFIKMIIMVPLGNL